LPRWVADSSYVLLRGAGVEFAGPGTLVFYGAKLLTVVTVAATGAIVSAVAAWAIVLATARRTIRLEI
jgi:hypothetical protein